MRAPRRSFVKRLKSWLLELASRSILMGVARFSRIINNVVVFTESFAKLQVSKI
jgi:hypothetical protein